MSGPLLDIMSDALLLPKVRLDYLIRSASHRYKVYSVPKRSGRGVRVIAQPAKEIKRLQYWVMKELFPAFAVHPAAAAYVKGKNILQNAQAHAANPYLLKLDFKDFFPSIKGDDFVAYMRSIGSELSPDDVERLKLLLLWRPKGEVSLQLSIGAPSSPHLSNAIMFNFDSKTQAYCQSVGVSYTRYADDLTFSMREKSLRGAVLNEVSHIVAELPFPHLQINEDKTIYGSKAHRRTVTGLTLANDGAVSMGRNRKRLIRAKIHHFASGSLTTDQKDELRGILAFAKNVEPDFIRRMEHKYGAEVFRSIRKTHEPVSQSPSSSQDGQ